MYLSEKQKEQYGDLAYSVVATLVGGSVEKYFQSTQTAAMVWTTCRSHSHIHHLVGMYLAGNSNRAEHNLNKLREYLRELFELSN